MDWPGSIYLCLVQSQYHQMPDGIFIRLLQPDMPSSLLYPLSFWHDPKRSHLLYTCLAVGSFITHCNGVVDGSGKRNRFF